MEGSLRSCRWEVKAQVQVVDFGKRREMHAGAPPGMSVLAQWEPERAWHDAPAKCFHALALDEVIGQTDEVEGREVEAGHHTLLLAGGLFEKSHLD